MATKIGHLIYLATQCARTAWYSSHHAVSMRLAPKLGEPPAGELPDWRNIYGDLKALLLHDWRNIDDGLYPAPETGNGKLRRAAQRSVSFSRISRASNDGASRLTVTRSSIRNSAHATPVIIYKIFTIKAADI